MKKKVNERKKARIEMKYIKSSKEVKTMKKER